MTSKDFLFAAIFSVVLLPGFSFSQSFEGVVPKACGPQNGQVVSDTARGPKIDEFNSKINRTAEALGVSVYEDYPVRAAKSDAQDPQDQKTCPPVSMPLAYAVPEPKAEPVSLVFKSGTEPVSYSGAAVIAWHALVTQIEDLGILPGTAVPPSFEAISERVMKASKSDVFAPRQAGQPSLFTEAGFISEFERATGSRFESGNYVRFLIDGEQSFAVKDALMKNAKKSLLVSSWAFYDDTTGYEAAQMLVEKKKQGVSVQVMVDDTIASAYGKKTLKIMKNAGIEVLRHTDSERAGDIWHAKIIIADDKYAVAGGMNFGDVYSHKGSGSPRWRDTDVLFSGPAVIEAKKAIGGEWNSRVAGQKLPYKPVDVSGPQNAEFEGGSARIAVVFQNPPKSSPILISIVKAMYGATKKINIENSYFVAIPVVTQAVLDARARGIEVNILTNSKESIDPESKPLTDVMAACLIPLVRAGVNVYLKQGATLHSKFMTVDGEFADIGSYNFHPRGERSDTELNVNILDRGAVAQLDSAFADDISLARKIASVKELEEKPGLISSIISHYFYPHLFPEGPVDANRLD